MPNIVPLVHAKLLGDSNIVILPKYGTKNHSQCPIGMAIENGFLFNGYFCLIMLKYCFFELQVF